MNNRIGLLLKVKDVTASRFAEMIGVQPSNISHLLSGRNKPSLDFIIKVCETFPDINIDWLMFGKGNMFKSETTTFVNSPEIEEKEIKTNIQETHNVSGIPDLFSQDYPSENSIVDRESTEDDKNLIQNDEKEIEAEVLHDNKQSAEILNSSEEVICENEKVEDNNESIIEEKREVISERSKSENDSLQRTEVRSKPVKMILVYADETFEILNLKE
jgi:transcriptional regulator with XRE-family HTH domain